LDCETLAEAYRLTSNSERAIDALRQATLYYTEIGLPDQANSARTKLGDWLEEAEQLEDSLNVYREAVELQPGAAWLRRNYANGLIKSKQLAEAAEQLYLAEQSEPDAPYLALRRAELAKAADDRLAAQHWAEEALQRQPGWDDAQAILDWAVSSWEM
jgi:tetratricopeptide (TPR) repeat protein